MVKEVGAFEAKTHLSRLLDEVEKGQSIFITRHGRRVAEVIPVPPRKRAKLGSARGPGFYMSPDFDEPLQEFKDYM